MSAFKRAPVSAGPRRQDVLAPLRVAEIVSSKPVLPAEIISTILDYLPVPDLLHFARTSKRMREMVYDDTRWVQRLQVMGCWNEAEARKRFEEARHKRWKAQQARHAEAAKRVGIGVDGVQEPTRTSVTLFDADWEEEAERASTDAQPKQRQASIADGFDAIALSSSGQMSSTADQRPRAPESLLSIFGSVRSTRGHARQEYGKIYGALAPFYFDIARSENHTDPIVFRSYRDPEHQARMLAQLKTFAKSDMSQGWQLREGKLDALTEVFENAVLREFENGLQAGDVEGRMRKYAYVLVSLNGGQAGIDLFIRQNSIFLEKERLGSPMECIDEASVGNISLEPSHAFLGRLSAAFNEQVVVIERVFPPTANVLLPFLEGTGDVISDYITLLFDEAHPKSIEWYLKAVSGIYEQSLRFAKSLRPTSTSETEFYEAVDRMIAKIFEPHIDLYLGEELDFLKHRSDAEVTEWKRKLTEQDASMESLFMSNVNRQADKRDFLTSFKRVVMMPVNVLPTFPISSPFGFSKPATAKALVNGDMYPSHPASAESSTRSSTPVPANGLIHTPSRSTTPLPEAPTTELAAKA
ncbi:MAG: F-box protein: endocytic membrane traffic, recycling ReCYcling 1, partial [Pleopsidium flavum]